jgi:carotenoid cleavage dioxygenase-like enzyme
MVTAVLPMAQLYACHSKSISLNLDTRTAGDIPEDERPQPAVITVNPNSSTDDARQGTLRILSTVVGDFPAINQAYVGRKNRWGYVATMVTGFGAAVKFDGVAKVSCLLVVRDDE